MAPELLDAVSAAEGPLGAEAFGAAVQRAQHPVDRAADQADPETVTADRVRGWYLLAVNHPLWRRYIPAAREDEGYYIGGELQWSKDGNFDSLHRLRAAKRTTASVNHVMSTVDILVGFERQNRFDLRATPQGTEDQESARILTWVLRFVQEQAEVQEYESQAFEDGLIRGMSVIDVKSKFTGEGLDGEIEIEVLTPGEDWLCDPYFKRYDLSDARFTLKFRWVYLDEVIAQYPEHEDTIKAQVSMLDSMFQTMATNVSTDGGRGDAYGGVAAPNVDRLREEELFFDPRDRRVLVVEAWYRDYQVEYHVVAKSGAYHQVVPSRVAGLEMVKADPEGLALVTRRVKRIREALVLPATHVCLYDKPSRYTNDQEHYPHVLYLAKRKRDYIFGLVRNMKDPQLLENTRISQLIDMIRRWANIRPLVPKGSVEDERGLEEHWSTSAIFFDPKKGQPGWYVPQGLEAIARGLLDVATQFKLNLREITGINTDLLGLRSDDASGIAIARRQAQGQIIATIFFDNFKRTRKLVGQRLARRLQEVFTTEQILRLIDPDTGEPVEVRLNPVEAQEMQPEDYREWLESVQAQRRNGAGRPYVLRSVKALKFDIIIAESPTTPSARATQLASLMEIIRLDPRMLPALIDKVITLADVSDRPEIMRRIRALQIQAGILPPEDGQVPAAAGPAGLPSGTPPPVPAAAPTPAGIASAAAAPIPPTPGAPTASSLPPAPRRGVSQQFRRTLQLASGGAPVSPGGL